MHAETAAWRGRVKLPFAEYSVVRSLKLLGTIRAERYASLVSDAALRETPGSQYAGGHRIRVTPVPIPNTEVKPDTADGTARDSVLLPSLRSAAYAAAPASVGE